MKSWITIQCLILMTIIMWSTCGCFSYMTYKNSEQKVALRKATIRNDQAAIRAINLGEDPIGVGTWEALTEQPFTQVGAGVLDLLMLYGTYEGVRWIGDSIEGDNSGNASSDNGGTTVITKGDGNTVNVGNTTTTTSETITETTVEVGKPAIPQQ